MAKELTFKGRLVAKTSDCGYITYVFKNENYTSNEDMYIMCTRFPNWQQPYIGINAVGFITVRYVVGGEDSWFDGSSFLPYKNTDVHFLKFVPFVEQNTDIEIVL